MSNTPFLDRKTLERIEERVADILINLEDELIDRMLGSDGLAYGDLDLPREERLLKYVDDDNRGVNTWLRNEEPDEYQKRTRAFVTDAEKEGVL